MIKKNEMDSILRELSFEVNFVNFETSVRRLGLTAFSKIFDFVQNVRFPITQQKKSIKGLSIFYYIKLCIILNYSVNNSFIDISK